MNKRSKLFLTILLVLTQSFSCFQRHDIDRVGIVIEYPSASSSTVKLWIQNILNLEQSFLIDTVLDSSGRGSFNFTLVKPAFASLEINQKHSNLYITPGDELHINFGEEDTGAARFIGTGSEVNNYLSQIDSISRRANKVDDKNIFKSNEEEFAKRVDTLTKSLTHFHQLYINDIRLPTNVIAMLAKRNGLIDLSIKQAYGWNYMARHNFELPKRLDVSDIIPFDSTLLNSGMIEYANILNLNMHLKSALLLPINNGNYSAEDLKIRIPVLVMTEILEGNNPIFMKEFLLAKNVDFWMSSLGLTPAVFKVYSEFKKGYPTSRYLPSVISRFNKWQALSSGKVAPEIKGVTPQGDSISSLNLKGKIIYADVWATWCGPCIEEIPFSKKLQNSYERNKDVVFLNISVDKQIELWKNTLAKDSDWKGVHINTDFSIYESYLINGIPRYILIDKEGKIVMSDAPRPSSNKAIEEIDKLLDSK